MTTNTLPEFSEARKIEAGRIKELEKKYANLKVLRQSSQLIAMLTIIRDKNTKTSEFVFYADRIIRLLIETALEEVPFAVKTITTPVDDTLWEGAAFGQAICGVSIVRAGEAMENGLRAVCRSCRIGKIVIQRCEKDFTPKVYYHKLPEDVSKRNVILLDPMLATGSTALKALDFLLDHNVSQERIVFVTMISCPEGLNAVFEKYPNIKIITAAVDKKLNSKKFIVPGIGDFGDRYFGT